MSEETKDNVQETEGTEKKGNIEIFDGEEYDLDDPNDVAWLNHKKKLKAIEEESAKDWAKAEESKANAIASFGAGASSDDSKSSNEAPKQEVDLMECFKQFV